MDPFWTVYQQNGAVVFPYTNWVHSGTQSVLLQGTGGGQKWLWLSHTFETPQYGKVSVWVYDTKQYIYFTLCWRNTGAESCDWGIGNQDWDYSTYYIGFGDCSGGQKTSVPRTVGWHKFSFESTRTGLVMSIDDQVVYSGPGGKPFNQVRLILFGPGYGVAAFDDFSFETAPEPPPIFITSLSGNGQLTWTNLDPLTNGVFTIEWAPAPGTNWHDSWSGLHAFAVNGTSNTVSIPMLYRVKCVSNVFVPFAEGFRMSFSATNASGANWTEQTKVLGFAKPTAGTGKEYAICENIESGRMRTVFLRSTDTAVYRLDTAILTDTLEWQMAPVGTTWTNLNYEGRYIRKVTVEAIEDVTVPAGTFTNCYKFRKQVLNASPDDIPPGGAAEWYEWVCPGVGMVKWIDYWADDPPAVYQLESRSRASD